MVEPEDAGLSLHSNGSCKNSQTFMERPGKLGGLLELSIGEAFMLRPSQSITISKRSNKKSTQKLLKLYRTALPSFPYLQAISRETTVSYKKLPICIICPLTVPSSNGR